MHDAHTLLKALQHRGRDACGIAAIGKNRIDVIKWVGNVNTFDLIDLYKIFPGTDYHTYLGHVRYATRGKKDKLLEDAHPHVIGGKRINRGSHILILDCDMVAVHNGQVNEEHLVGVKKSDLNTTCDTEAILQFYKHFGEKEILKKIPGAYTLAIADKKRDEIIVLRDRTGIKPGVLGMKEGKHQVSSEDVVFAKNGGEFIENITPGSAYYLSPDGGVRKEKIVDYVKKHCFFEWNYIAAKDSLINNLSVRRLRESLGAAIAEEYAPKDVDLVTFLPRCPESAARRYAEVLGVPFIPIFYKMRGERSFQGATGKEREVSITGNLHLLPDFLPGAKHSIEGKKIVIMDDSTVRGNNSKRARNIAYDEAKVKEAVLLNYTPKIGIIGQDKIPRCCYFGVDMPLNDNFVARAKSDDEISKQIGMTVVYPSVECMLKAYEKVGMSRTKLCTFCIGGEHPYKYLDNQKKLFDKK